MKNDLTLCIFRLAFTEKNRAQLYLLEFTTHEMLKCFLPNDSIEILEFFGTFFDKPEKVVSKEDWRGLRKVKELNNFFDQNPEFDLVNFESKINNKIFFSTHDDGEVHLTFEEKMESSPVILRILRQNGFDPDLALKILEEYNGKYIKLEKPANLVEVYKNFDDFINKM